jgi:hypothetical protein
MYDCLRSESESYITTDGQSASLSWNKAPIWGSRPDFYCCETVAGLLMWGELSDEKTGLWFIIVAGPHQRSHFRVRVPLESWPYFTVSDTRLPFSRPPTTRRATVEVFDSASTRGVLPFLSERSLIWSSGIHGKYLLLARILGSVCCMYVYTETFVVPRWSPGIHLHGNVSCTEWFPRSGLHDNIFGEQT